MFENNCSDHNWHLGCNQLEALLICSVLAIVIVGALGFLWKFGRDA